MQTACERCGAPCHIERAETILCSVVCARCQALPDVRAFMAAQAQWQQSERSRADAARIRFESRKHRLLREDQQRLVRLAELSRDLPALESAMPDRIQAALQRARNRAKPSE